MNIIRYPADRMEKLLHEQKIATMPQLKSALGTSVTFTVLRKLAPLGYRTSYSHGGTYYTLEAIAQYDERGLWSYRDIHFSRHGTLLNTAATLVNNAPAGYFTDELDGLVHVATKDALRQLVEQHRLWRRKLAGLSDDLLNQVLLCAGAVPGPIAVSITLTAAVAIASLTLAIPIAVGAWQITNLPDRIVNAVLEELVEPGAFLLNLGHVADFCPERDAELMGGIAGQTKLFAVVAF